MCALGSKKTEVNSGEEKTEGCYRSNRRGRLTIIGIGPGDTGYLSQKAVDAIKSAQVIVGYRTYLDLLGGLVSGKELIVSGMTEEVKRAEGAIEKALEGKSVCVVSSGDPGVYGMAGLLLELLSKDDAGKLTIEIIPGILAVSAGASLLGAPLMHDFAMISLSDLLTDPKLIKKRVELAALADFVIVLYNPKSKKRTAPFENACRILLDHKSPDTPVGIVRNAARRDEEVLITSLKHLASFAAIDMVTTVIIGNSKTYVKGKYMLTPRGYHLKITQREKKKRSAPKR